MQAMELKKYGIYDDDTYEMKLHTDAHTIAILLEQIRRFSSIVYDI